MTAKTNSKKNYQNGLNFYRAINNLSVEAILHLLPGTTVLRAGLYKAIAQEHLEEHDRYRVVGEYVRPKLIGGPRVPGRLRVDIDA